MESSPSTNSPPPLCARGCGFFGGLQTRNMCSKCYKEYLKEEELLVKPTAAPAAVFSVKKTPDVAVSASESSSTAATSDQLCGVTKKKASCQSENCKKKLTPSEVISLKCRCGGVFCSKHRYPEVHSCTVNYKKAGKEVLAKLNQLCTADKLEHRI